MGLIYYIRNEVNGMGYVGQTTQPGNKRYQGHLSAARSDLPDKRKIDQVISEIGEDCVHYEILESGLKSFEDLNSREEFWIQRLGTLRPDGYNMTSGGRNNFHVAAKLSVDEELVRLYQSGLTVQQVADCCGCSRTRVLNHLRAAGVPTRPRKGRKDPDRKSPRRKFRLTRDEVVNMVLSGMTYEQIATVAGVAPGSMKKIMRQMKTRYCDLLS